MSEPQVLKIGDKGFIFSENDAGYHYAPEGGELEGPFETLWHAVKTAEESTMYTREINGKTVIFHNYARLGPPGRTAARGWFWHVTGKEAPADFYGSYTNMASAVAAAERAIPEPVLPPVVAQAPPPPAAASSAHPSLEEAREAAIALKNSHGAAAVKEVLARFTADGEPVTKVADLPDQDREDFITEARQYAADNPGAPNDPEAAAPA